MPATLNQVPPSISTDLPPFPNDIPTAPLLRLSLPLLRTSPSESVRLYTAATTLGFFYLDLRADPLGSALIAESDELFSLGKVLFELGRDELEKYDYREQGSYFGYKGLGKGVVNKEGRIDRNEFYNIPKDDFLSISSTPFAHPDLLARHSALLTSYMTNAHALLTIILDHLSIHLHLPTSTLRSLHAQALPSGDHIRIVKSPPQLASSALPPTDEPSDPSMGAHTDFGTLTLLMNRLGGLQVLPPSTDATQPQWLYVRPLSAHAIINVGDALVKFSAGLLKSNIHRVVTPPGKQALATRYSLVYFMRPGDEVPLRRLEGGDVIPGLGEGEVEENVRSKEWIRDKAFARRVEGRGGIEKGMAKERETSALAAM